MDLSNKREVSLRFPNYDVRKEVLDFATIAPNAEKIALWISYGIDSANVTVGPKVQCFSVEPIHHGAILTLSGRWNFAEKMPDAKQIDLIGFDMVGKSNSSNNSSNKNTTTSKRSASFSDLRVTGSRNNEGGFTFYYDVTLKQCSGRKVKVQLTFKDSKGNYLYGKNNKKLIWSQTFDVKSDNIKYTDQSFTLTINQLNIPSDGKNFCYQFAAYDDKTGDLLGKSENKEKHLGNALVISDERLTLDEYEDGKPVITYYFHLDYLLPEAHDLKLVCALETNQNGKRHHRADGREMIQEYVWKNKEKSVYGGLDGHMGFDHDEINPLPGKNTYWIHIYVYDANTGDLLAKSKAFAFQAEDEGKTR